MDNYSIINQLIDDKEKVTELARKPVHMIKGDGTFCESNVEKFVESATNLLAPGESYAIISIIGPQISGKSFLLNQLFGTNFDVMNATKGREQTTKGILLAQSQSSKRCALIMDVEGSDGRERGDDDVSFERQSALFALTVSDIMMINMWFHDIGRQQGGSVPLLRTVFQERVKLDPRKTKVLVVVRDYYKEPPFETLEEGILKTMEEIWMSVHHRPDGRTVQFSDYIEVMVVALPNKKTQKREFEEEVTKLREWFAKENIVGLRHDKNSTSGFSFSAKNIWEAIKQNKQLDLPSHHLAVSTHVCEKVAEECLAAAIRDKDFEMLNDAASSDDFIVKLEALLQNCVTRYDKDTEMSDETQRDAKRDVLKENILQAAEPFANKLLHIIRSKFLYEEKDKVTALLDKADDPAMEIPTIVEDILKSFTESCGGLESKYKPLCLENCNMLRKELTYHAISKTLDIKEQLMKEELDRAKAEAERFKEEAKREREEAARAKIERQSQELERAKEKAARAKYDCEKVAKECLAAAIRDKDFERLNDAASSEAFIVKLETLLQNCVTRYDEDTEMSDETQRDAKRDELKEKILKSAEPFAKKMLDKIRSELFSENKDMVTAELNEADDPAMKAPSIVEDLLELFTKLCGGLGSKYKLLCLESRDMLRTHLDSHARSTAQHIKECKMHSKAKAARIKRGEDQAKLLELELSEEEAAGAEEEAAGAIKEAVRPARDIKEKADAAAAAEHSRSAERSSYRRCCCC